MHLGYKKALCYEEATYNEKGQDFLKVRKVQNMHVNLTNKEKEEH